MNWNKIAPNKWQRMDGAEVGYNGHGAWWCKGPDGARLPEAYRTAAAAMGTVDEEWPLGKSTRLRAPD